MFIEIHYGDDNKPQMLNVNQITEVTKTADGHAKIYFGQQNDWLIAAESYEWVVAHLPKAVPVKPYGHNYTIGEADELRRKRYPRGNK